MTTFTSKGGFIPEYNITVGLKYLSLEYKSEDDLINYDWKIEDFKYIDIDGMTVYGEDINVRGFKDVYDTADYYGTNIASRLLMKERDYCMCLSEDMPLYQKIKEQFIITLDFSKLLDKLERKPRQIKNHGEWYQRTMRNKYGICLRDRDCYDYKDITFYESFYDFIGGASSCKITKKGMNFNFVTQDELDNLNIDGLSTAFDSRKYNMFNYDDLYNFFKWYIENRVRR